MALDIGVRVSGVAPPSVHPTLVVLHQFTRNKARIAAALVLAILLMLAAFPQLVISHDPLKADPSCVRGSPNIRHPFGTDHIGRDVLSRTVYGCRLSLLIGLVGVALAATIGVPLGLLAGFYGRWLDALVMRLMDIMLAFPSLLLAMAVVAVFGYGTVNLIGAVGVSLVPQFVRLVRGTVLSAKQRDYVEAARVVGCGNLRIAIRHILPNVAAPILVLATVAVAWALIIGASLSFLGLGVQAPAPEWGVDVAKGRPYLGTAWWISTFPGLALMLTVIAVNLVGDGLREALDPKLRTF